MGSWRYLILPHEDTTIRMTIELTIDITWGNTAGRMKFIVATILRLYDPSKTRALRGNDN